MAFVNERMTRAEMDEFAAKSIHNPGNEFIMLKPYRWTINRDENIALIWALQEREEPHEIYFLLLWKDVVISVKLRKSWVDNKTCNWKLISIDIPESSKQNQSEIVLSLKDALTVYGVDGDPDEPNNKIVKVQFGF